MRNTTSFLIGCFFILAGALHFIHRLYPAYLRIMPPFLPHPALLIFVSGVCEIAGGIGLLSPRFRRTAGIGLLLLLLAVFPANIYPAIHRIPYLPHSKEHLAILWLRLPLQFVLMWLIWWCSQSAPAKR